MFLAGLTLAVLGALALPGSGRGVRSVAASIAAAGMLAGCTSVVLAGAGTMDAHGMIAIPALHDAASEQPLRFTAVCSRGSVPVCLNPAYSRYLPAVAAVLSPVLREIAGLPGAPARVIQVAATYHQETGNEVSTSLVGAALRGKPPEFRMLLPDTFGGVFLTTHEMAGQVRDSTGPAIVAVFVGDGPGASAAQQAVAGALAMDAGLPAGTDYLGPPVPRAGNVRGSSGRCDGRAGCGSRVTGTSSPGKGSPVSAAARRFAAQPAAARRAWLAQHLTALRAGQITLGQLP
jgi:hypothetical protein